MSPRDRKEPDQADKRALDAAAPVPDDDFEDEGDGRVDEEDPEFAADFGD